MNTFEKVDRFLKNCGMSSDEVDIHNICNSILAEMNQGLKGEDSSLEMIPTYVDVPERVPTKPVIVIDAGGTNFRVAVVRFSQSGGCLIQPFIKTKMPGIDHRMTKQEFFNAMADIIRPVAEQGDSIGFCFSYPTEIFPNRDGRLIRFVKEIKASEVEGQFIGKNLLDALGVKKKIVILNDTVATLLAGKASETKSYSGYVGFILGTGMNGCYIEACNRILKLNEDRGNQIINTELGNFDKLDRGIIDMELDDDTENPGINSFEKMISGAYLGELFLRTIKKAVDEGLIKGKTGGRLSKVSVFRTEDMDDFLRSPERAIPLADVLGHNGGDERQICMHIASKLVERAAKLAAASMSALCLKSREGRDAAKPICITVEGSTFYRLKDLRNHTIRYLKEYLTVRRGIYFEIVNVAEATIKGAAIAGLL